MGRMVGAGSGCGEDAASFRVDYARNAMRACVAAHPAVMYANTRWKCRGRARVRIALMATPIIILPTDRPNTHDTSCVFGLASARMRCSFSSNFSNVHSPRLPVTRLNTSTAIKSLSSRRLPIELSAPGRCIRW